MTPSANPNSATSILRKLLLLVWRAMRLRCPACGGTKLFLGWFTMHDACSACGRPFRGDAGYFLGSIYFNYGVTGMLVVAIYFAMYFGNVLTNEQRLAVLAVFVVLFPLWFFRYARALWMAFDEFWDPWKRKSDDLHNQIR
jgi:uncharacterized protein (DUF983 family)